jgi:4-amino-4-deoxy-L-arabinose transferase-like glycosyltransferase
MSGFVQPVSPSAAMPPGRGALPRVSSWVGAIVFVQLVVLVATSTRYGYHPDEMYFIVAGAHPAFGYPDQPSLVPLLSWAMHEIGSGSLLVLRLPSALAAAATTLVAALLAREIGGHQRPQLIAACCTASSGFALSVGHYVTTTTFDMLSTSIVGWLLIRGISKRSGPALLMAGIVTGIGFEAKPQVAFVAAVAVIALLVVGPRWPLRSPWLVAGVGAAIVLAAPYLIWQAIHGWPQLTVASNIGGTAEGGRAGFVPYQFLLVSPVLAPVWIAGLVTPIRRASQRSLRFVPVDPAPGPSSLPSGSSSPQQSAPISRYRCYRPRRCRAVRSWRSTLTRAKPSVGPDLSTPSPVPGSPFRPPNAPTL